MQTVSPQEVFCLTDRGWEIKVQGMSQPHIVSREDAPDYILSMQAAMWNHCQADMLSEDVGIAMNGMAQLYIWCKLIGDTNYSCMFGPEINGYLEETYHELTGFKLVLPEPILEREPNTISPDTHGPFYHTRYAKYVRSGGISPHRIKNMYVTRINATTLHTVHESHVNSNDLEFRYDFWFLGPEVHSRPESFLLIMQGWAEDSATPIADPSSFAYSLITMKDRLM